MGKRQFLMKSVCKILALMFCFAPVQANETLSHSLIFLAYEQKLDLKPRNVVEYKQENDSQTGLSIRLSMDKTNRDQFAAFTREHIGKPLAIYVNGELSSLPIIRTEIPSGTVVIHGIDNLLGIFEAENYSVGLVFVQEQKQFLREDLQIEGNKLSLKRSMNAFDLTVESCDSAKWVIVRHNKIIDDNAACSNGSFWLNSHEQAKVLTE